MIHWKSCFWIIIVNFNKKRVTKATQVSKAIAFLLMNDWRAEVLEKQNILCPYWDLNPGPSSWNKHIQHTNQCITQFAQPRCYCPTYIQMQFVSGGVRLCIIIMHIQDECFFKMSQMDNCVIFVGDFGERSRLFAMSSSSAKLGPHPKVDDYDHKYYRTRFV